MRKLRSQSAMEYLMTYGWAILIIAVVLAVLFQLGVFSSGNFQPHAQAGACQVSRTIAGVSLEGKCNGMLPQYVAQFTSSSQITIPDSSSLDISGNQVTISFWVNLHSLGGQSGPVVIKGSGSYVMFGYDKPSWNTGLADEWQMGVLISGTQVYSGISASNPYDTWLYVVGTYNDVSISTYIDGSLSASNPYTGTITQSAGALGFDNGGLNFKISNVQIYNTSLSSSEIQALYLEGIGGAPIRPQNLVGWWPLNGNANDYSGNGNNGQLNSVTFSSSWENGYTAP